MYKKISDKLTYLTKNKTSCKNVNYIDNLIKNMNIIYQTINIKRTKNTYGRVDSVQRNK